MNHEEQFEHRQQIQKYIMSSNINQLLENLLQRLMLAKPKDPIDFLIKQMQKPQREINFVIGPPGLRTFSFLEKVRAEMTAKNFVVFNCGQYILEIVNQLSPNSQSNIKEGLLINREQMNEKVLQKIKKLQNNPSGQNLIIEGYPRTLQQAISLQKAKIFHSKLIIMNVNDDHLRQICQYKLNSIHEKLSQKQLQDKALLMMLEYRSNLKELKAFYNQFAEIDLSKNSSEEYILQELRRVFDIKTRSLPPRSSSQVLIIGAPCSGRTTLAKKLSKHYNLSYVSSKALISNEIRKDSLAGRRLKENFAKNQLVDEFTIQKLIEQRVTQKDCRMQGFILEGYPKTKQQYENLKNLKIEVTMIVAIDLQQEECLKRNCMDFETAKNRFEKWRTFREFLKQLNDKIFWIDSTLSEDNLFEEVKYEFQKYH